MTIDEQIGTFLNSVTALTDLAGAGAVWLCKLPEGQKTGLVYQQISGPTDATLDMRVSTAGRWQFTSYAETALLARQILDAALEALQFFRGEFVENGDHVECDTPEDNRGPMFDYERGLYRYDADLILNY